MMNQIKSDFAKTIKTETGADVEFTMINAEQFSIFTQDGERFPQVVEFIKQIPGVTFDDMVKYSDSESGDEFYAYFKC